LRPILTVITWLRQVGEEAIIDQIGPFAFEVRVEWVRADGWPMWAQLSRDEIALRELSVGQIVWVHAREARTFAHTAQTPQPAGPQRHTFADTAQTPRHIGLLRRTFACGFAPCRPEAVRVCAVSA